MQLQRSGTVSVTGTITQVPIWLLFMSKMSFLLWAGVREYSVTEMTFGQLVYPKQGHHNPLSFTWSRNMYIHDVTGLILCLQ